jgi:hypothetical protein
MKLSNVIGRKANNAAVLAADTMNASQPQNGGLADRQHGVREITSHYDVLPRRVRENGHQAAAIIRRSNASISLLR